MTKPNNLMCTYCPFLILAGGCVLGVDHVEGCEYVEENSAGYPEYAGGAL